MSGDYSAVERLRNTRRPYVKAFGGMAVIVLLGAMFDYVPDDEAAIVAALLSLPPLCLWIVESIRWRRCLRQTDARRTMAHDRKATQRIV